ncbi:MAG TPA: chemotaxis protein CheA [Vicinamibacteria bacterium]|nr:chemotaxis protein CheA [Vicinamibacteria bacterium]
MSDFQVSDELLNIYIEDARGHLEALDHCLLSLERDGLEPAAVQAVLGPLHTLKGNSGMMGFGQIKDYVHRLEDVFAQLGEGGIPLGPGAFDKLFAGASALRDAVEQAFRSKAEVRSLDPERAELDALLGAGLSEPAAAPALPAPAPAKPRPAEPRRTDERYVAPRSSTVRVDFAQLDHLLNLVGELIIHRTKLDQVGTRLAERLGGRELAQELIDAVHHLAGVSAQLQETVMDVRMLPIRHVFERFPRMVRDLARAQGKEIELILEGDRTRVDKAIIDEIGEPLVHLIRNSVDHGIETPRERIARGKTPTGTILLSAAQESNHVLITIMDDGSGIDPVTIRKKAVERGLLKPDENLSDRELVQLIFSQGFSTRSEVTEVSGRGVGLDVVIKSIERLSGLIEVESVPGVGTKFIIQLPLTLAIISALMVEVAGRTYALPLAAVLESLKFRLQDVHRINGRDTLRLRDRIVPLVRLGALFGFSNAEAGRYAVILGRGDKRVGLVVDRLFGQQEIVIKALDVAVSGGHVPVAGATIMGDGRVVLILDVAALFEGKRQALLGREAPALPAGA